MCILGRFRVTQTQATAAPAPPSAELFPGEVPSAAPAPAKEISELEALEARRAELDAREAKLREAEEALRKAAEQGS